MKKVEKGAVNINAVLNNNNNKMNWINKYTLDIAKFSLSNEFRSDLINVFLSEMWWSNTHGYELESRLSKNAFSFMHFTEENHRYYEYCMQTSFKYGIDINELLEGNFFDTDLADPLNLLARGKAIGEELHTALARFISSGNKQTEIAILQCQYSPSEEEKNSYMLKLAENKKILKKEGFNLRVIRSRLEDPAENLFYLNPSYLCNNTFVKEPFRLSLLIELFSQGTLHPALEVSYYHASKPLLEHYLERPTAPNFEIIKKCIIDFAPEIDIEMLHKWIFKRNIDHLAGFPEALDIWHELKTFIDKKKFMSYLLDSIENLDETDKKGRTKI